MFSITLGERRRELIRATLHIADPPPVITQMLAFNERFVAPTGPTRELAEWLRCCHAHYGAGYPKTLINLHERLNRNLAALQTHPAMWGHAMMHQQRTLPITCWRIDGAVYPDRLYSLYPEGTEGSLVPVPGVMNYERYTSWMFAEHPHGPPRLERTMYIPQFATSRKVRVDNETQQAATANVRAAVLAAVEQEVAQNGGDVPETTRSCSADAEQLDG